MKQLKRKEEVLVLKQEVDQDKVKERFFKLLNEIMTTREDFWDSCDDEKLFSLYEKLIKFIRKNTIVEEIETEYSQEETIDEIKQKCGEKFITELKELFKNRYVIHATGIDDPNIFFEDAFRIYGSQELISTTYTAQGSIDQLLFNLFNKMHLNHTKIVVLDTTQEDVIETGKVGSYVNMAYIPKEYIKAHINLDEFKITYNPHYKERLVNGENKNIDKKTELDEPIKLKFERDYFGWDEKDFNINYLTDVEACLYCDLTDMLLIFPDEDGYSKSLKKQAVDYAEKVLKRLKKVDIQKYRDEYSVKI